MFFRKIIFLTFILPLLFPPFSYSREIITSASEYDYPPFCTTDRDGKAVGFSVDLLRASLDIMDHDVSFHTGTWSEIKNLLEKEDIQALPLVGRTPEREHVFDFTFPYMTLHGAIVVREGTEGIEDISDLSGEKVAVMKGDNAEEFLRRGNYNIEIFTTDTFETALTDLSNGLYKAVILQRLTAVRLINDNSLLNLKITGKPLYDFRQELCFAVKKGDSRTLSLLNEGLSIAFADGTYNRLHAKWFSSFNLPSGMKITIGGDNNFPPFEFISPDGRPSGFNIDISNAISRATGIDIEIKLTPWEKAVNDLERENIDALQGMFYSAERNKKFDFTSPHTVVQYVIAARKGAGEFPDNIEQLRGKKIAVQNRDLMHDYLLENNFDKKFIAASASQEDSLRELSAGLHDYALVQRISALYQIKKNGWQNLELGKEALLKAEYCFAVPKNRKNLLSILNEGLKLIEETGEYREIYNKWMGIYEEKEFSTADFFKYISIILLPLLLILVASITWSWLLKKQVSARTEALLKSEEQFSRLVEGAPDAIFIHSDYILLYLNQKACDLFGIKSPQELTGLSVIDRFHPSTRDKALERVKNIYKNKSFSPPFEQLYVKADGAPVPVEVSAVHIDYRGKSCALVFARDITSRKEAEEDLVRNQEMLARTESVTHTGSWEWDIKNDKVIWSDETFRIFERDKNPGAPPFSSHETLFHPDDMKKLKKSLENTISNGEPFTLEMRVPLPDGNGKVCLSRGYPVRNDDNEITGLYGSIQDITELAHARERIEHLNNVLKAIRGVNQLIVREYNPQVLIDEGCRLLTASRGYRSAMIILVDKNEKPNMWSESGLDYYHDNIKNMVKHSILPECCTNFRGEKAVFFLNKEKRCSSCPLKNIAFERNIMCANLIHNENLLGFLAVSVDKNLDVGDEEKELFLEVAEDIAYALSVIEMERERQIFEKKSEALEGQLQQAQKMESIGRLAGGVAHDYNNMLSVITGYTELAMDKLERDHPVFHDLGEILTATKRSAEITKQLLAFARKQPISPKIIDLNKSVETMLKTLRRLIGEDIDLAWLPGRNIRSIKMDPSQIDQILANLCVNARDAITGVGKVTIGTENISIDREYCEIHQGFVPGEFSVLTVSDDGCGIDNKTIEMVFEPFFTTKPKGMGTGLGLATVYGIVKQNNGFINVYSESGQGTTFRVYFPAEENTAAENQEGTGKNIEAGNGELILLVEDEPAIMTLGGKMLEKLGYNVLTAATPKEALELASESGNKIKLLLTDVIMPEMNGRELSAKISGIIPGIKTIYMSGYTADVIAHRGILDEGVYFIQKPFSMAELGKKVSETINSRKSI